MKASEKHLEALHNVVAQVLTAQIKHQRAETEFNAEGEEVETGEMVYTASPATIASAIKFLKDNDITCDIENNENMDNLREVLAKKQKRSRMEDPNQAALRVVEG